MNHGLELTVKRARQKNHDKGDQPGLIDTDKRVNERGESDKSTSTLLTSSERAVPVERDIAVAGSEVAENYKEAENIEIETDLPQEGIVINAAERKHGKRFRNKIHSYYFCMKTFQNLPRQFEKLHWSETTVAKILAMEKNCKSRKNAFTQLIRVGDFNHNCEVLSLKKGELVLVRLSLTMTMDHVLPG
nr:unnamed protein product [Callosobruchus analis]